jgi:hypothetical protein
MGGVQADPGEVAQPFGQLRQEWVRSGAGDFCSDQLPQLPLSTGVCGGESYVEFPLEDMGGTAELGWPSWAEVAGVDLVGGTPHLDVGDQLGRHWTMALGRPRRRFSCGIAADLVGELGNKL